MSLASQSTTTIEDLIVGKTSQLQDYAKPSIFTNNAEPSEAQHHSILEGSGNEVAAVEVASRSTLTSREALLSANEGAGASLSAKQHSTFTDDIPDSASKADEIHPTPEETTHVFESDLQYTPVSFAVQSSIPANDAGRSQAAATWTDFPSENDPSFTNEGLDFAADLTGPNATALGEIKERDSNIKEGSQDVETTTEDQVSLSFREADLSNNKTTSKVITFLVIGALWAIKNYVCPVDQADQPYRNFLSDAGDNGAASDLENSLSLVSTEPEGKDGDLPNDTTDGDPKLAASDPNYEGDTDDTPPIGHGTDPVREPTSDAKASPAVSEGDLTDSESEVTVGDANTDPTASKDTPTPRAKHAPPPHAVPSKSKTSEVRTTADSSTISRQKALAKAWSGLWFTTPNFIYMPSGKIRYWRDSPDSNNNAPATQSAKAETSKEAIGSTTENNMSGSKSDSSSDIAIDDQEPVSPKSQPKTTQKPTSEPVAPTLKPTSESDKTASSASVDQETSQEAIETPAHLPGSKTENNAKDRERTDSSIYPDLPVVKYVKEERERLDSIVKNLTAVGDNVMILYQLVKDPIHPNHNIMADDQWEREREYIRVWRVAVKDTGRNFETFCKNQLTELSCPIPTEQRFNTSRKQLHQALDLLSEQCTVDSR